MKDKLFGWLGRSRDDDAPHSGGMADLLREYGVAEEALSRALQHRHVLQTRLISTLAQSAEISEQSGLEALARYVGLPGVSLRRSVVALDGVARVPQELAEEHLVLPVQENGHGAVVVATADPLAESLQQQLTLLLGRPVRAHLALHMSLRRTIRACYQLRAEHPEASFLLGDEVDPAQVPGLVTRCTVEAVVPHYRSEATQPSTQLCAVVASAQLSSIEEALGDVRVVPVADGLALLRALSNESVDLIVADAMLPGRGGADILRELSKTERFAPVPKLLVFPAALAQCAVETSTLTTTTAEEVGSAVAMAMQEGKIDHSAHQRRARARYFEARALLEEGKPKEAVAHLEQALKVDPLFAEACVELGRLQFAAGDVVEAERWLGWAHNLGVASGEDLAQLAVLIQRRGDRLQAAQVWRLAASQLSEERAKVVRDHADQLVAANR